MVEYNAGDAKLRIVPDAEGFQKELQAKLDAMKVDFTVRLNIEMAQAKADMDRFRNEQDGRNINQRVNPQFTRASEEMAAWRAEQRGNAVTVPVKVDGDDAKSKTKAVVADMGKEFGKLLGAGMDLGKVMGIASLVGSIPGAINAVVGLTAAVEQLGGAALVVPGAIGGLIASFGTLAVGMSGVSDAYSAMDAASITSASTVAASTAAQNSLKNAVIEERHAQKDVTQARIDSRHSLEDLNIQLRGGHLNEAEAINAAKAARRDLAQGQFKDAIDREAAQLRVQEADQRVVESHQSLIELTEKTTDANVKGIEGSDQVVAAKEREVRALESVAAAQTALAGVNGADKAAEALAKLSPAAAEFVDALHALKPAWTDLQKTVSGNLFEGLATQFTTFADGVLPNLKSGMGLIATAWNGDISQLLTSLGSPGSKGLLDRILGDTAAAQDNFRAAIDPLVQGLGTLTAAGADALPRLATAIGDIATRFSDFITAADKDGRLKGWIDAGLDGFTHLGGILLNLGDSIHSITTAFGGGNFLASFDKLTTKWADFLSSGKGQSDLKRIFDEGRAAIDRITPIVKDLGPILGGVFTTAVGAAEIFLPVLTTVADVLAANPALVIAISTAFLAWKTIDPIVRGLKGTLDLFVTGLLNVSTGFQPIRDKAEKAMSDTGKAFEEAGGTPEKGVGKFASKLSALSAVGGPLLGLAGVAIPIVIEALANLGQSHDTAAAQAQAEADALNNLAGSLQRVSNLASPATLDKIAGAYQNFSAPGGIQGNAATATTALNLNPTELAKAALPGNDALYNKFDTAFQATIAGSALASVGPGTSTNPGNITEGLDKLAAQGVPMETVLQAVLGGTGARDRLQAGLTKIGWKASAQSVIDDAIKHIQETGTDDEKKALLAGTALNTQRAATSGTVAGAGQEQTTAHGNRRLTAAGHGVFDQYAPGFVGYDGNEAAVVLNREPPADSPALKGNRVEFNSATGQWTVYIGPDNAAETEGYETGGPTTAGLAVLHDDEFVLSARANKYPSSFKHALNEGRIDPKALPHFDVGGSHMEPGFGGPGPGNVGGDPASAAPTGGLGGGFNLGSFFGTMLGIPALGSIGQTNADGSTPSMFGHAADGRTTIGGHAIGLDPKLLANDPAAVKDATDYLKTWGTKTASSFGKILFQGGDQPGGLLGGLGLEGSVLSPNNKWNQDLQKGAGFFAGADAGSGDIGTQTLGVGPGGSEQIQVPTSGTSVTLDGQGGATALGRSATPIGSGVARWRPVVAAALTKLGPSLGITNYAAWTNAILGQIQLESGGDPNIDNLTDSDGKGGHQAVYGLGQFLPSTFQAHNVLHGDIHDGTAAVYAMIDYVAKKYGQNASGVPNHINQGVGYDQGGILPPGMTLAHNKTGQNERILNPAQNKNYEAMLPHFAEGGPYKTAALPIPKFPMVPIPDIAAMIPPSQRNAPGPARPPAGPPPAPSAATDTPAPQPAAQPQPDPTGPTGQAPDAGAGGQSHLLPAVETGIKSGATALGNAVSTAAAVGSMGMGGGGGGASSMISGLFNLGGKAVTDAANVAASFLVGTASNIGGNTGSAYGSTYHATQAQPATAQNHHTTNYNGGMVVADPQEMRREMDLRDAQHTQSIMANH